ncbi:MAG TPA: hypothetical protein VEZ20_00920 [Allosphingosinicella sp.]|nr:hypothetical protein [Allosphingosinicella sp.]
MGNLWPKIHLKLTIPEVILFLGIDMIDLQEVWLPAILSYAHLVADESALRDAWIKQDRSKTSVYYPGELIDQIFEDLDSNTVRKQLNAQRSGQAPLATAIARFLDALTIMYDVESAKLDMLSWGQGRPPPNADRIFDSPSWAEARRRARELLLLTEEQ